MFAVAGPVTGRAIALTNRNWHFNLDELGQALWVVPVDAINDFEAQAWALALLQEGDYRSIGDDARATPVHGVKVVLGPGTGLGVAALVPVGGGWQAVATEGGHVSFGAASQGRRADLRAPAQRWSGFGGDGDLRLRAAAVARRRESRRAAACLG